MPLRSFRDALLEGEPFGIEFVAYLDCLDRESFHQRVGEPYTSNRSNCSQRATLVS